MSPRPKKVENIWPKEIVAIITGTLDSPNLAPIVFAQVSTVYEQPISAVIGLSNGNYTLELAVEHKEFTMAYPSAKQAEDVLLCGTKSGRDTDKLSQTGLTFSPAKSIAAPLLNGAIINCECKVVHSYNLGTFTVLIANVEAVSYGSSTDKKLYALGGENYGTLGAPKVIKHGRK